MKTLQNLIGVPYVKKTLTKQLIVHSIWTIRLITSWSTWLKHLTKLNKTKAIHEILALTIEEDIMVKVDSMVSVDTTLDGIGIMPNVGNLISLYALVKIIYLQTILGKTRLV